MNYKIKKGDFTGTEKLFETRNEAEEYAKNHYENIEIMSPDKWNYYCKIKLIYCKNNNSELKIASIFDKNELPKEVLIVKSEYDK